MSKSDKMSKEMTTVCGFEIIKAGPFQGSYIVNTFVSGSKSSYLGADKKEKKSSKKTKPIVEDKTDHQSLRLLELSPNIHGLPNLNVIDINSKLIRKDNFLLSDSYISYNDCPSSNSKEKKAALLYPMYGRNFKDLYLSLKWQDKLSIFIQLANAINILHKNNIVSLDIKVKNVFIADGVVKLLISKTARYCQDYVIASDIKLGNYTPRENISGEENKRANIYSKDTDVWSFGVLALYFLSDTSNDIDIYDKIKSNIRKGLVEMMHKDIPILIAIKFIWILTRIFDSNSENRITMEEILTNLSKESDYKLNYKSLTLESKELNNDINLDKFQNWMLNRYPGHDCELFFLALDLFYRYSSVTTFDDSIIPCIAWMANKLTNGGNSEYIGIIDTKKNNLLEIQIVNKLDKILYRDYLFSACKNFYHVIRTWRVINKYPESYLEIDEDRWISSLDSTSDTSAMSKHQTIKELLDNQ